MPEDKRSTSSNSRLSEDWLAVLIAFLFILLATIGLLGPAGIQITY
jgi:hypothetical protein